MKTKNIKLNEKDIAIFNKIKNFISGKIESIEDKDMKEFVHTINWLTRLFEKPECECQNNVAPHECGCEHPRQKMGHGKIKGLSGLTWDLSKMPADEAEAFKADIERDIAHDKMMHPWKYMNFNPNRPFDKPFNKPRLDYNCNCGCEEKEFGPSERVLQILWQDRMFLYKNKQVTIDQIATSLMHGKRVAINGFEIIVPRDILRFGGESMIADAVRKQLDRINEIKTLRKAREEYKGNDIQKSMFIENAIKFITHVLNDKFDPTNSENSWKALSESIQQIIEDIRKLNKK